MSERQSEPSAGAAREEVAAEVLELGQTLFEAVIAAAARSAAGEAAGEPFPAAEVRAAAAEFFGALRLLLQVGER